LINDYAREDFPLSSRTLEPIATRVNLVWGARERNVVAFGGEFAIFVEGVCITSFQ
jgi:hypothetical protein